MSNTQRLFILLLFTLPFKAQQVIYSLKEPEMKRMAEIAPTASLFVVIDNEKDPADAALVNAVRKYWKNGKYKFLAKAEFADLKLKNELLPDQFYLYEWFHFEPMPGVTTLQLAGMLKGSRSGYFVLSLRAPKKTENKSTPTKKNSKDYVPSTINLTFDLQTNLNYQQDKILDGYYDLMVKYLDHEVNLCKDITYLKDLKRDTKNGYVYFGKGLEEVQTKDILLVKEQIQKVNKKDEKDGKRPVASDAVAQFNPPTKNVYTVYPEDIKMAIEKHDKKVLLYTNNMLISAEDGAVVAVQNTSGIKVAKPDYGFLLASWSIVLIAAGIAFTMR